MTERFKPFLHRQISAQNYQRVRIFYKAYQDLKRTYQKKPIGYPVSITELKQTLINMGISPGDVIHVQSSLSYLQTGMAEPTENPEQHNTISYAISVIETLIDLVGAQGTILMNTDALHREITNAIWAGEKNNEFVFDSRHTPSNRGLISEIFWRRPDTLRSTHPWYNVSAWGKQAEALLSDHEKSTPYAMDKHSPWIKLNDIGAKVLLLGCSFTGGNPLLHAVEYTHPQIYPRGIYLDKPISIPYRAKDESIKKMDVMLHAPLWWRQGNGAERFCLYLNQKYGVYQIKSFNNDARIVCFNAKDQYDAVYKEMTENVTWYDPQFWNEAVF